MKNITLTIRADDAEPILLKAAEDAAKYGAWCDHITIRTYNAPRWRGMKLADAKKEWMAKFLQAKRIVESFGIEYEQTSEPETLTIYIPTKVLKSHIVEIAGLRMRHVDKSVPDPKNAVPEYRSDVHAEACRQAAKRAVRKWKETL